MPVAVLDGDVVPAQQHLRAVVQLQRDLAVQHDVVVDAVGGVHPRMVGLEAFGQARHERSELGAEGCCIEVRAHHDRIGREGDEHQARLAFGRCEAGLRAAVGRLAAAHRVVRLRGPQQRRGKAGQGLELDAARRRRVREQPGFAAGAGAGHYASDVHDAPPFKG
jgi:hypothetical protein